MAEPGDDDRAAALAHELHNALAVIAGHAQLLHRQAVRGDPLDPRTILLRATTIGALAFRTAALVDALHAECARRSGAPPPEFTRPPGDA